MFTATTEDFKTNDDITSTSAITTTRNNKQTKQPQVEGNGSMIQYFYYSNFISVLIKFKTRTVSIIIQSRVGIPLRSNVKSDTKTRKKKKKKNIRAVEHVCSYVY